jgi:4-amino-4-deoxy-L-arabinose transferase-like glycosyltransferase
MLMAIFSVMFVGAGFVRVIMAGTDHGEFPVKISAAVLGIGSLGVIVTILSIFQILTRLNIIISIVGLSITLLMLHGKLFNYTWSESFKDILSVWKKPRLKVEQRQYWPMLAIVCVIVILYFYHSVLTPIDHFDALIYHSGMAKVMYNNHGMPLISGSSPGIEISANYPPLYPSLGAFLFVISGQTINDLGLRALNPLMAILSLATTYKLGELLGGKNVAIIALSLLTSTSLFMLSSVFTLNYAIQLTMVNGALLFLVFYLRNGDPRFLFLSGIACGFSLLINYTSIYFVIPVAFLVLYLWLRHDLSPKHVALFFVLMLVAGGFWYIRNWIVLGNPIYPWASEIFGGLNLDKEMIKLSMESVRATAAYVSLGNPNPPLTTFLQFIFINRVTFPSLSILTILGIVVLLAKRIPRISTTRDSSIFRYIIIRIRAILFSRKESSIKKEEKIRKQWSNESIVLFLAITMITIIGLILVNGGFFPRYFVVVLGLASLLAAIPLSKSYQSGGIYCRAIVLGILFIMLIHPGLTAALGGKMYHDIAAWAPPSSKQYLWYFSNPGVDYKTDLMRGEGDRVLAWEWINDHVKAGEKVATWESRIYYIKNADLNYFFLLDGREASPLYKLTDKHDMLDYLKDNNVKYVLVLDITSVGKDRLPLMKYLGTSDFPSVYAIGNGAIYHVGRTDTEYVEIGSHGWRSSQKNNNSTYFTLDARSTSPRIFAASDVMMKLSFEYLDKGTSPVYVNDKLPLSKQWIDDHPRIIRTDSGQWKTYSTILISNPGSLYHELGIYSNQEFTIRNLKNEPYNNTITYSAEKVTGNPNSLISTTSPLTTMIYETLDNRRSVILDTSAFCENATLEIYKVIIDLAEPNWNQDRRFQERLVVKESSLNNPVTTLSGDPGFYTIVVREDSNLKKPSVNIFTTAKENSAHIVKVGDLQSRIFVNTPDDKLYRVRIIYKDIGTGNIDFNLQDIDGKWKGHSILTRTDSGSTKVYSLDITGRANSTIVLGMAAHNQDFIINNWDSVVC